jgi:hypothetical protein
MPFGFDPAVRVPTDIHEREFLVECYDELLGFWYFCSRVHGIERAIIWAAAFREIKRQPSRVRDA